MKIVTRKEAKEQALTRYFTGKPCMHGHIAERLIWNSGCAECDRLRQCEKARRYRTKHPEKVKQFKRNDYARRRAQVLAACVKYRSENKKSQRAYFKKYKQENNGKVNAVNKRRDLAKKQRTPIWLTEDDIWMMKEIYELAALRSKKLGYKWHVDHIVPLQGKNVSGLHIPSNLQVIPYLDNILKRNHYGN